MRWLLALLVLLALQFVPGVGIGDAAAACSAGGLHSSRAEAYSCAKANADAWAAPRTCATVMGADHSEPFTLTYTRLSDQPPNGRVQAKQSCLFNGNPYNVYTTPSFYWPLANECPAGSSWDDAGNKCHDPQQCLAKEPLGSAFVDSVTSSTCSDGCEFKAVTSQVSVTIPGVGSATTVSGWEPTGNACAAGTPAPQNVGDPQKCIASGNDAAGRAYTTCVKANGEHCYTGKIGRQICWRPGETGEKTDQELVQKREVGSTATPPSTTPPAGSSLAQTGIPQTATTMVGGNTFNTTTTNYTTGGPEAAPDMPGAGESDDGAGGSSDGEGQGSVSGGVDCDTPPVVQGDPILANIVLQTWGTRCAAEDANAVKATGDIEDCDSPFVVTGPADDPNTSKLKGIRAEICGSYGDANGDGQPDWTEGEAPPIPGEGEPGPGDEPGPPSGLEVGTGLLDVEGFLGLGASAPLLGVLDLGFTTFDMDSLPFWADLVAIMRAIVLMVCAFGAVKILMGGSI